METVSSASGGVSPPLSHGLSLASAYAAGEDGEPAFTTYLARGTRGTVDYALYSPLLSPVGRLEPLSGRAMRPGIPNRRLASDHLALVVRLRFRKGGPRVLPAKRAAEDAPA